MKKLFYKMATKFLIIKTTNFEFELNIFGSFKIKSLK